MAFVQQRAERAKLLLSRGARMCAMDESDIKFDPSAQQELRPPDSPLGYFSERPLPLLGQFLEAFLDIGGVLDAGQFGVEAVLIDQGIMRAALDNGALPEH